MKSLTKAVLTNFALSDYRYSETRYFNGDESIQIPERQTRELAITKIKAFVKDLNKQLTNFKFKKSKKSATAMLIYYIPHFYEVQMSFFLGNKDLSKYFDMPPAFKFQIAYGNRPNINISAPDMAELLEQIQQQKQNVISIMKSYCKC